MNVTYIEPSNPRTQEFLEKVAALANDLPNGGKGGWKMVGKTIILLVWAIISYTFAVKSYELFESWVVTGLAFTHFGFALAFLTINVGHDAGHRAYSNKEWLNALCGFQMNLTGGNIFSWRTFHRHHHDNTNIENQDPDIYYGWFLRILSSEKWRPIHKYQWLYVWILYLGAGVQIIWASDLLMFITGKMRKVPVDIPKREYGIYILWKAIHITLFCVIPALVLNNVWYALLFYFFMITAAGYVMALWFQVAHIVDTTQFVIVTDQSNKNNVREITRLAEEANSHEVVVLVKPSDPTLKIPNAWIIHELYTTSDIAPRDRILTWLFGGLTMQVEHHLFPQVCHLYYREIQEKLVRLCEEYDMPYNMCPTFLNGLVSHGRKLWKMGQKPRLVVE